jgi:hypothetical protein
MSTGSTDTITLGSDTVIGSFTYKRILKHNYPVNADPWIRADGVREDTITKKVYYSGQYGDQLLYDFSLNANDTFRTVICFPYEDIVSYVDSITLLDGQVRKRITFQSTEQWIEGIGSTQGPFTIGMLVCSVDIDADLVCYYENGLHLFQNPGYTSCYFSNVSIDDRNVPQGGTVFPNPVTDLSTLQFSNELINECIEIYAPDGKIIRTVKNYSGTHLKIPAHEFTPGIYVARVSEKGSFYNFRFVVIR